MASRSIAALVCTGDADLVEFREVEAPVARPGDVLAQVHAVSVNRGELHRLIDPGHIGWRPGWDFAGEVVSAPAGAAAWLEPGARVFGMCAGGSWAQEVSLDSSQLAAVPDGLSWEQAAALPVAGLTAARTLRLGSVLSGRDVLVTGAAGGVGRFAVQLADAAGARVTAVVGDPGRAAGLESLGAHTVAVGLRDLRPGFDLILESVGGGPLRDALRLVGPDGLVVSYGNSSRADTAFSISDFYPKEACLRGFYLLHDIVRHPAGPDLRDLAERCAEGSLRVDIGAVADWSDAPAVFDGLLSRRIAGKAVLRTSGDVVALSGVGRPADGRSE